MGAVARADFCRWLVRDVREEARTFLFHDDIAGAEWIVEAMREVGIKAAAHHSGMSTDERRSVLDRFKTGDIRALSAARTLDEGIDAPDADLAVLVAGSSQKRQRIQRIGRVLRPGRGKLAKVVICYIGDSRDDPGFRREGDPFYKLMSELGVLSDFRWPEDQLAVRTWLGSDAVPDADPRPRPSSSPVRPSPPGHYRPGSSTLSLGIEYDMVNSGPG